LFIGGRLSQIFQDQSEKGPGTYSQEEVMDEEEPALGGAQRKAGKARCDGGELS
jgi:hypothetical protein